MPEPERILKDETSELGVGSGGEPRPEVLCCLRRLMISVTLRRAERFQAAPGLRRRCLWAASVKDVDFATRPSSPTAAPTKDLTGCVHSRLGHRWVRPSSALSPRW